MGQSISNPDCDIDIVASQYHPALISSISNVAVTQTFWKLGVFLCVWMNHGCDVSWQTWIIFPNNSQLHRRGFLNQFAFSVLDRTLSWAAWSFSNIIVLIVTHAFFVLNETQSWSDWIIGSEWPLRPIGSSKSSDYAPLTPSAVSTLWGFVQCFWNLPGYRKKEKTGGFR